MKFSWILILLALGLILFPLVGPGFFVSDDGDWMIIRLSAFFASLREGQFPVRFLVRLNDSYGYPVANFLYPGFLYIGSFLHALGLSFTDSVKAIFAGSLTGAAFFMYGWLRKYFRPFSSELGAVSFVLLPYVGFDLYRRGSVGEILAFLGVSMCLFSISWSKRALFAISLALLILAHNSLALLFAFLIGAYLLYEKKTKTFFVSGFLGLGASAFFWVPALVERSFTFFTAVEVARPQEYFLSVETLYLVMSGLFIVGLARILRLRRIAFFLWAAVFAVFFASPLSEFFWRVPLMGKWFQFPFRFLSLLAVSVPFLTAAIVEARPARYAAAIFIFLMVLWGWDASRTLRSFRPTDHPEGYYVTNEGTTTVRDEYLPRWVSERPKGRASERIVFYDGRGTITPQVFTKHTFDVTVAAKEDSVLQINTIYYPGWSVAIDNQRIDIDYTNPFGLMRVPVSSGVHTVEVGFRETPLRFIIDLVSLISLIALIVFALAKKHT